MPAHIPDSLEPMRIIVLSGGDSAEREVSLESGAAVADALAERGHRITIVDPAEADLRTANWSQCDAVFIALHGTFGEDGQVQQILENARVPFTGSDSETSRVAFSKSASKERFAIGGIPTLPYALINKADDSTRIQQQIESIGLPCVIKPDAQGSSHGVSIVESPEQIPQALTNCFQYDNFGVVEPYVVGSEWTVGMIDATILPPICIETDRSFFDFSAKYEDDETRYRFEFDLPTHVVAAITNAGRRACESLGTQGLVRADIILDRDRQPWVLEVNTIPGLTSHSLLPKAAAEIGIDFGALCEIAVRSGMSVESKRRAA